MSQAQYLDDVEESVGGGLVIDSYEIKGDLSGDKKVTERFTFGMEDVVQGQNIYFNPFIVRFFPENPFKREERHYPIDFGYLRSYGFMASIKIPDGYKVKDMPSAKNIALPGNSGALRFGCEESSGTINLFFDFKLKATQYNSGAYPIIKQFFGNAVSLQDQTYIVLEKI